MSADTILRHEFVEFLPDALAEGTLYVSIPFATVAHKCCCGCGCDVVTPLSPAQWSLTYDGESISLKPSIGNWSFACRSHYWVERGRVRWARQWSEEEVAAARERDRAAVELQVAASAGPLPRPTRPRVPRSGLLRRLWNHLLSWFGRRRH